MRAAPLGSLEEQFHGKDVLRSAREKSGELFVMTSGISMTLMWPADKQVSPE